MVDIGFVELDDAHFRTSVIMLKKKNTHGLAYFKGLKDLIIGRSSGLASIIKGCSGQPDNRIFSYGELTHSIDLIIEGMDLVSEIILQLDFKKNTMKKSTKWLF